MNITEPFVLKSDVQLIPCGDLSDDVRGRITFDEGDYTLSRSHGRVLAQVIDRETAALLALFREPRTIADAVFESSRSFSKDPEIWLDELLPHLGKFLENRVLVPAGSEDEKEIRPQYDSGARFGRWDVVRCAHLVEDTEIYQLRSGSEVAALKIARDDSEMSNLLFENEEAILRHLEGSGIAPRLIETGRHAERSYLILEWVAGVDAGVAAAQRRHDRAAVIEICAAIADAYAKLHALGVVHADVHPRNVVVGEKVTLLDFGYSRFVDQPSQVGRGGLYYFFEPEYITTFIEATPAGEQYSLAALLYLLIAGRHYLDFRFDRVEMEAQVQSNPPLPFAQRDIPPWPEVEEILFRGLEKDPARRHESISAMAALLAEARDAAIRESLATPLSAEANEFLEWTLKSFARGGEAFVERYPNPPRASINYGCAGAAVGLLRIAETRSDPALLALSNVWRSRATALIESEDAFYNAEGQLPREALGDITPYHTESGIHAAAVMIAAAMGDVFSQRRALEAFLAASNKSCTEIDLTLGRSSSLLAASMLLAISGDLPEADALREFGGETMRAIWKEIDARPAIAESPAETHLGIAHGWAGYIYAAMRWCAASGDALPEHLVERLHEYAALKTVTGRGVYWRMTVDSAADAVMPGWCNGTAGQVFLFTLAHRLLGDEQWLELAKLSASDCWDQPRGPTTLCCGTAGRAYALLNLYKHTGATEWLSRARQLANHAAAFAVTTAQQKNALWKGELGVAVLIADLASPENARMPFFE